MPRDTFKDQPVSCLASAQPLADTSASCSDITHSGTRTSHRPGIVTYEGRQLEVTFMSKGARIRGFMGAMAPISVGKKDMCSLQIETKY